MCTIKQQQHESQVLNSLLWNHFHGNRWYIGEIQDDFTDDCDVGKDFKTVEGEIDTVTSIITYHSCTAKVTPFQDNDLFGECTKCSCTMKITKCKEVSAARVLINSEEVTLFEDMIQKLINNISGPATSTIKVLSECIQAKYRFWYSKPFEHWINCISLYNYYHDFFGLHI